MTFSTRFGTISQLGDLFRRCQHVTRGFSTVSVSFKNAERLRGDCRRVVVQCRRSLLTGSWDFKEQTAVLKKRQLKKKKVPDGQDGFRITAFSTAEEYHLENLLQTLPTLTNFKVATFEDDCDNIPDAVHVVRENETASEVQDLFFFREGSVVMWNISDTEAKQVFDLLKLHEDMSFSQDIIQAESEVMFYTFSSEISSPRIVKDVILLPEKNPELNKYAISNAIALSVHLGAYEATLDEYIEAMGPVTEDLKAGKKVQMTREEVFQKTGQLFALRHNISLSSDLLDTPDFYWDRPELENLYHKMFSYFCISKRTKVINEKINHCIELTELLSSHLNDKHHVRLEWMIIILIMVEVAFEVVHYLERYLESLENSPCAPAYQTS